MLACATPPLGWTLLDYDCEVDSSSVGSQIREGLPIYIGVDPVPTCGECAYFRAGTEKVGRCGQHGFLVAPDTRCCVWYEAP